jgi:predicted ATPase/DNA-binding SARP family transcriptional activator
VRLPAAVEEAGYRAAVRYGLLGPLRVIAPEGTEVPVRGAKQRALLTLLLLARGAAVPVDRLVGVLWGEEAPANPVNALQAQISQLRRLLGSGTVVRDSGGYALPVAADGLDVVAFEDLAARGQQALRDGDAAAAKRSFADALALWRGTPMEDLDDPEWVLPERVRLDALHITALQGRLQAELDLGGHGEAVAELEALVVRHSTHERFWELLMQALYRSGRQADALRAYQHAREALAELGIAPGSALRQLEADVLAQHEGLAPPEQRDPIGNLPSPLTRFIGRDLELERVNEALQDHRLVTVVGPGGAGKTRLATEVARRLQPPGGAWLVTLETVTDPDALLPSTAAALGLRDDDRNAPAGSAPLDRIAAELAKAPAVLVLDNCEHLITEAARASAALLERCPSLRILSTSREVLAIPGEALIPLGSLDPHHGMELFLDRASAGAPELRTGDDLHIWAEQICERLDGMPLAIELAAARARTLPVPQIAERLSDRFRLLTGGARTALPRHQTLRAVVDWSYDLLSDSERRLFTRLSVFVGGCSLDAAEQVCADDQLPREEILGLLSSLVDKSLVFLDRSGPGPRYRLLQTLWEYSRERLDDAGEADALRARHAAHHLDLARRSEPTLRSGDAARTRELLSPDIENLWAALDWLIESDEADAAFELVDHLAWLWFLRGEWSEGVRFCTRGLSLGAAGPTRHLVELWRAYYLANSAGHRAVTEIRSGTDLDVATEAVLQSGDPLRHTKALLLRTSLAQRSGDTAAQERWAQAALVAAEACGDEWLLGMAEMLASTTKLRIGQQEEAGTLAASSVARFERLGEHSMSIEARTVLLTLAELSGHLEIALDLAERISVLADELRMPGYQQWARSRLGFVRHAAGDLHGADQAHFSSLSVGASRWGTALAHFGRGLVARSERRLDDARTFLDAGTTIYDELGAVIEASIGRTLAARVELDRGDLVEARQLATSAGEAMTSLHDAGVAALASEVLAEVALTEGDPDEARSLLRASTPIGVPAGHGLWLLTRLDSERVHAALDESPAIAGEGTTP